MKENPFNVIFRKKEFLFPYDYPLVAFPFYIDIELTNKCNLDCIMCSRQIMQRPIGFMGMDIFRKIVDEVKEYDSAIRFSRWGEPTQHPKFSVALEYARSNNVLSYISTNAFSSTDRIIKLYHAKPDVIRFSFQGTSKETFEKFRFPAIYDVVARNIRMIFSMREEDKSDIPYMIISSSLTNETEEEKETFKKYWLKYVDRVEFSKTSFSRLDYVGRVKDVRGEESISRVYKPCTEIVTKLSVNYNGDVSVCCADYDNFLILGSLYTSTLKTLWNSDRMTKLRDMLGEKLLHQQLPLCATCFTEDSKFDDLKKWRV